MNESFSDDESGQAIVEWIVVVGLMVAALAALFGIFPQALSKFYRGIVSILLLPLP